MKYLSVCSGIEAASVAWHPLGWEPVAFSEIEKFPSAVLAHHYPKVPNLGDMTKFHEWPDLNINLLVGGTPCQAFSVAGLRQGLSDPRGNLTLTFLGLVDRYRPEWVVWENVPGVLSDRTNAFGQFLAGLGQLGYGWAYRMLDAQYFNVAQRRRRMFVVANLGGWTRAASVLFEPESVLGNPPPSREARKDVAPCLAARTKGGGGLGTDFDLDGGVIEVSHTLKAGGFDASEDGTGRGTPLWPCEIAPTLNAHFGEKQGLEDQHALNGGGCSFPPKISQCLNAGGMGRSDAETETLIPTRQGGFFDDTKTYGLQDDTTPKVAEERIGAIRADAGGEGACVAYSIQERAVSENIQNGPGGKGFQEGVAYTLEARHHVQAVSAKMAVRRLTPVECERLQGFPDHYTQIPFRGKPSTNCPDGPRYKALGNSMAVPCMAWIGKRIAASQPEPLNLDE